MTAQTARLQRLEHELHAQVHTWRFQPVVEALQALRGVQCTVAATMVAALGDLTRFDNPRQLMHYLGLTPSAYASGARRQHGSMTKTGNTHARRARVEGAWAYRYPAKGSRHLHLRLEKLPPAIQAISWKAQVRLCQRYRQLMARGTNAHQVVVAMARALSAFRWAIAKQVPVLPQARGSLQQKLTGFERLSEEAQPRCGVILGSVKRPQGVRVPRVRQAPDGGKEGGTPPTDSSVLNRRSSWLRLFR